MLTVARALELPKVAERLPKAAAGLLALALVYELTRLSMDLHGAFVGAPLNSGRPRSIVHHDFAQTTASAHLFGEPAVIQSGDTTPDTPVALILAGTLATQDPAQGFAIIGTTAQSTKFYRTGALVTGGVTLREVYPDHAVIERSGRLETLALPHSSLATLSHGKAELVAARDALRPPIYARDEIPESEPEAENLRAAFADQNARVGAAIHATPLLAGGYRGVKLEPGNDPSMLGRLGLKPGDVVMGVDGVLLTPDHLPRLSAALASGRTIHLAVLRPRDGQLDLEVDTTPLQGLVSE